MPLARVALYAEGVEVYVACTWDSGDTWLATMRHIAAEGRCFVIGSGCSLTTADIPASFPSRDAVFAALGSGEWINPGDSVVVRPGGEIIAGPLHEEHGILYAELDVTRAASERRTLDVVGHYARNDVFGFTVDRRARVPSSPPA